MSFPFYNLVVQGQKVMEFSFSVKKDSLFYTSCTYVGIIQLLSSPESISVFLASGPMPALDFFTSLWCF